MITIAIIGILIMLLCIQLKSVKPEFGTLTAVAGGVFLMYMALDKLSGLLEYVNRILSYISIDSVYLETLLKIIGITYISEFASDICRDAGYSSIGSQIELGAKLSILVLSMPVFLALIDSIESFGI